MSDISAPACYATGYVSDAELMGWLSERSTEQNSMLRDMMHSSTVRTHLLQSLTNIKALVNADGHPDDIAKMIDEVIDTPEFEPYKEEIKNLLGATKDKLYAYAKSDAEDDAAEAEVAKNNPGKDIPAPTRATMADDAMKADKANLLERLDGEIGRLGTDDQMAMVQIQALSSQTRELSTLASNLMSSRSQARDNIVGNIRA